MGRIKQLLENEPDFEYEIYQYYLSIGELKDDSILCNSILQRQPRISLRTKSLFNVHKTNYDLLEKENRERVY